MPDAMLRTAGLFSPTARAFREMTYQFQRPFVLDSSLTETTFGLDPTPLDEALRDTARAMLGQAPASGSPSKSTAE